MVRCVMVWPKVVPVGSLMTYQDFIVGRVIECETIKCDDNRTQVHLTFECDDEEYLVFKEVVALAGAQHYERYITICEPTK